jgi:hypothetical protein
MGRTTQYSIIIIAEINNSKNFAFFNAASRLRTNESTCGQDRFGLNNVHTQGKKGVTLLGDLATIICSYDSTAGYTSNSLASYFHDLGWRDRLNNDILHTWFFTEDSITKTTNTTFASQSLGGNYAASTPSDLSFTLEIYYDNFCY